jgi:hypothetical protein
VLEIRNVDAVAARALHVAEFISGWVFCDMRGRRADVRKGL